MTHSDIKYKVKQSITEKKVLVLRTNNFLRNIEDQLFTFLRCYIEELEISACEELIIYAIRELAANANKANMKRLYFQENNLNIHNTEEYKTGMESFKKEAYTDLNKYSQLLTEKGIYVKFSFYVQGDELRITIINNTVLSQQEEIRINDKIKKAWDFPSMEEAMLHVLEGAEGAGLGLVSIIMMFRNLGVSSKKTLKIRKNPTETHAIMSIPYGDLKIPAQAARA